MKTMKEFYQTEVAQRLKEDLKITNHMAVPMLSKIVVNMGVRGAVADKKTVDVAGQVLALVTGQKAKVTLAKKSIAGFKLREGDKIGLVVTLRGNRMYDFYGKLVNVVLPRIKDFRGVKDTSFDTKGNYTLGLYEYSVFPEIDLGKFTNVQGLEICIVTTAKNKQDAYALLKETGMPFVKTKKAVLQA